ncbi:CRISPR-associated endonuclease/helicase Cas3 [Thermobifida halotolerans]
MSKFDVAAFEEFYRAIHGDREPFPWQNALMSRLLDGQDWPDAIDVPTGLGKTSLLDIAVFAAATGVPAARRRVFFVVDRRLVVDEAYDHAENLAAKLNNPAPGSLLAEIADALRPTGARDEESVVEATRMRGGATWSWRWVERPDRYALVVGTVDQIGSRLLMRGYGVSEALRPVDAALVGTDSLILVDEAHLAEAMIETVHTATANQPDHRLASPRLVRMSATVGHHPQAVVHRTDTEDEHHPVAGRRLATPRRLHLVAPKMTRKNAHTVMAEQLAGWARALAGDDGWGKVVLTVCNTVARARAVFDALARSGVPAEERVLLTGRIRPIDRDRLLRDYYPRMKVGRDPVPGRPFHVVATQTVEVGANIDADALVTESASLPALIQRLGRLARAAERRPENEQWTAPAVVVHDPTFGTDDPVYGSARQATWDLLASRTGVLVPKPTARPHPSMLTDGMDASPLAMRQLVDGLDPATRDSLREPRRRPPLLWPSTLNAWTRTSPPPHPDPPVAPYLHGFDTRDPDVQLLWRDDIDPDLAKSNNEALEALRQRLQALPPTAEEMLQLPVGALRRWFNGRRQDAGGVADVEGGPAEHDTTDSATLVVRYRNRDTIDVIPASQVRPGDVVVLPTRLGGYDDYGWAPHSTDPVTDVADLAARRQRPVVRLHPRLLDHAPTPEDKETVQALLKPGTDPEEDLVPGDYTEALKKFTKASQGSPLVANLHRLAEVATTTGSEERRGKAPAGGKGKNRKELVVVSLPAAPGHDRVVLLSINGLGQPGDDDEASSSTARTPLDLDTHQEQVARQAAEFARNIGLSEHETHAVYLAARWHDEGKRDPRFQAMLYNLPPSALEGKQVLAKSGFDPADRDTYRHALWQSGYPRGMRHEGLSARIAACYLDRDRPDTVDHDLVLHLIATHHGRSRPLLPAVTDPDPVTVDVPGTDSTVSSADLLDWQAPERFARLNRTYGPWKLALLETVVRLADIWCSAGHRPTEAEHIPPTTPLPQPPAEPRRARHPVALPALDGRDPLGFLASLGLLRLLTQEADLPVRLAFDSVTATAHLTSPLADLDAIATTLSEIAAAIPEPGALPGIAPGLAAPDRRGQGPTPRPPSRLPRPGRNRPRAGRAPSRRMAVLHRHRPGR